jgi:hypothetical protein
MTPGTTRVITLWEDCGMSVEQIAQDEGLEIGAIKASLLMFSAKYRAESKEKVELDFTDDELVVANRTLVQTMTNTDDENLKVRCARYIRQDKKGRLDKQTFGKLNINVYQFNLDMQKARKALESAKEKVIEMPSDAKKELQVA